MIKSLQLSPALMAGFGWFRALYFRDLSALRACNQLVDHLHQEPLHCDLRIDGLHVESVKSDPGTIYIATASHCTCRGARHPWCIHRVLYRVLSAEAALLAQPPVQPTTRPATIHPRPGRPLPQPRTNGSEPPERSDGYNQARANINELFSS